MMRKKERRTRTANHGNTTLKPTSLPLFVTCLLCAVSTNPIHAFTDLSPRLQPSPLLQRTRMMQQSTATEPAASSATPPLFAPTSKYHRSGLARRRRWLVVDFDGTCTAHDTTPLLPRLAAFATRQRRRSSYVSTVSDGNGGESAKIDSGNTSDERVANDVHEQDLRRRLLQLQQLENEYFRLFQEAKEELSSSSSGKERDEKSLHEALDALDQPSNYVTQLVSESRVLRDLGHADARELEGILHLVTESAEEQKMKASGDGFDKVEVRLRHGCESTLARILSDEYTTNRKEQGPPPSCSGWSLAVLSINWCPALIDASLVQPVLKRKRGILRVDSCETEIPIWSNHVDGEGVVSLHVPGALAKRDRILELRSRILQTSDDGACGGVIVYVGDSSTDLAALLAADIGVLIGNSGSTAAIAERWGIEIVPLQRRGRRGFVGGAEEKKRLWRAEGWKEIDDMLRELDEHWS